MTLFTNLIAETVNYNFKISNVYYYKVKEMEQVIRRRHPNSLPAMMMVAASIPDSTVDGIHSKSRTVQILESRVKKLEKELESKDELSQQDLRAVEQKYNHIKVTVF